MTLQTNLMDVERYATEKAMAEGFTGYFAERFVKGFIEGWTQRGIEIACHALQMKLPIDDIAKLTDLTLEEIQDLPILQRDQSGTLAGLSSENL